MHKMIYLCHFCAIMELRLRKEDEFMERITYKKSFQAKLILSQETIPFYQQIKDLCATHKNVCNRISFNKEVVTFKRQKVAMMRINRKNIGLYLVLSPTNYTDSKIKIKTLEDKKIGQIYPMMVTIKNPRNLKYALELLEDALTNVGATKLCTALDVDYKEILYPRDLDTLVAQGLVKKYVHQIVDGKEVVKQMAPELCHVHFTAKLKYAAKNAADELYIITSYTNWDVHEAVLMDRKDTTTFVADMSFPKGTTLEFKICRADNWRNVEKGIWKEEIVNHHYLVIDKDLEVEDLIHNFRED